MVDADCYIQYAMLISVPLKYIVFCSFLSVAAQLRSLALHKHDEDFIFLPAYLIRLVEYHWGHCTTTLRFFAFESNETIMLNWARWQICN